MSSASITDVVCNSSSNFSRLLVYSAVEYVRFHAIEEHSRAELPLGRDADASQQVMEARVGAQRIYAGVYLQISETLVMACVRLFQPSEGLLLLPEPSINESYFIPSDAIRLHVLFQA